MKCDEQNKPTQQDLKPQVEHLTNHNPLILCTRSTRNSNDRYVHASILGSFITRVELNLNSRGATYIFSIEVPQRSLYCESETEQFIEGKLASTTSQHARSILQYTTPFRSVDQFDMIIAISTYRRFQLKEKQQDLQPIKKTNQRKTNKSAKHHPPLKLCSSPSQSPWEQ